MRGGFIILAGALAGVAATARTAHAQITQTPAGYVFKAKFTKGEKLNYVITSTTGAAQGTFKTEMPMSMNVLDVAGGIATVQMHVGPMTMNGRPLGQVQTQTVKLDSHGTPVGGQGQAMQGMAQGMPTKPLRVGQSYTRDMNVNQRGMSMTVHTVSTLKGFKSVGGRNVAIIDVRSSTSGGVSVTGDSTVLLSTADGSLVSMSGTQNITAGGQKMQSRTEVVRK